MQLSISSLITHRILIHFRFTLCSVCLRSRDAVLLQFDLLRSAGDLDLRAVVQVVASPCTEATTISRFSFAMTTSNQLAVGSDQLRSNDGNLTSLPTAYCSADYSHLRPESW